MNIIGHIKQISGTVLLPLNDTTIVTMQHAKAVEGTSLYAGSADSLLYLGGWSLAAALATVVITLFLWRFCNKIHPTKWNLKIWFIIAWILGFVVYDIGMSTGDFISFFTNAPMAVIHAFSIFLLDNDVSEIHDSFHDSWIFMMFFSFSHALAAFISTLFIIKHFGFNLKAKWRLNRESKRNSKSETYVFWGNNMISYRLIKSIKSHYGSNNGAYRIIVVKTNNDADDTPEGRTGINRIFEFLSLKNSEFEQLQELECLTTVTYADLNSLSCSEIDRNSHDILGSEMGLKSLKRVLCPDKTGDKIHFLFLSDDEKQNLHNVSVLLNDSTLQSFATGQPDDTERITGISDRTREVIFYCHARYNSVHRVIEDQHCTNNINVKVIDSSHINVEMLKKNDDVMPVNFVEVESDGSVSSAFNALVVGFSEVGQDSVRYLYEFGAFVKSGGDCNNAVRSDFHLDVVDKDMADKAGVFVSNAPAIKPSLSFISGKNNPDALIALHQMDCCSVEFYLQLEDKIKTLNYIVVATDNDELNISLGVRIFKLATRYRKDLDKLCILVRIHNDDDGHFSKIAEYYNKLWAAQIAAGSYDKTLNKSFKRTDDSKLPLYIFGQDKDIYTYDNIIDNSTENKAIEFKEKYVLSVDPQYVPDPDGRTTIWKKQTIELMQLGKPFHPTYCGLMKLRRTQSQDYANCLHCRTKEMLAAKALNKCGIPDFNWSTIQRYLLKTDYSSVSGGGLDRRIIKILNVLAQTEHLRWNASHEILGYVYDPQGKNEVLLHHGCLTDWANLDEETRSYDYNVVDITLGIIIHDNKI